MCYFTFKRQVTVTVAVFNEDNNPVGLTVSSNMKAREACHKLALLNKVDDDPHWVLTEYLTDLGLGKYISLTGVGWVGEKYQVIVMCGSCKTAFSLEKVRQASH